MKKNIIIKVSGDLVNDERALDFIKDKAEESYVVVIAGSGTMINRRLKENGYEIKFDEQGHRYHPDIKSRKIARDVLEETETELQDKLINCFVVTPYIYVGRMLCHINADHYIELLSPSFDEAYCLTLPGRDKTLKNGVQLIKIT